MIAYLGSFMVPSYYQKAQNVHKYCIDEYQSLSIHTVVFFNDTSGVVVSNIDKSFTEMPRLESVGNEHTSDFLVWAVGDNSVPQSRSSTRIG